MSKVNEILEAVKGLTVLELAELVKAFRSEERRVGKECSRTCY